MSDLVLIGVYKSIASAEQAIGLLQRARFPERQISAIVQDGHGGRSGEGKGEVPSGSQVDAAIAGTLGYLYGGAVLWPKGLGPVLVAGPMAETLSATLERRATEPGSGQWLSPLSLLGLTANEIRSYEWALRDHMNLVVAQGSPEEIERARRALATMEPVRLGRHSLRIPASGAYAY